MSSSESSSAERTSDGEGAFLRPFAGAFGFAAALGFAGARFAGAFLAGAFFVVPDIMEASSSLLLQIN